MQKKENKKKIPYKLPIILAVILHLLLFIFLFVKFLPESHFNSMFQESHIIQAEAVFSARSKPIFLTHEAESSIPKKTLLKPEIKTETFKSEEQIKPEVIIKKQDDKNKIESLKIKKAELLKKEMHDALQKELLKEAQNIHVFKQKAVMDDSLDKALASEKAMLTANAGRYQGTPGTPSEIDKYKSSILQAIASNWIVPDQIAKNDTCVLVVNVAPQGVVIDIRLLKSSGNQALDRSAENAVLKSSPLPVPSDPILFNHFRSIKLTVRPEGIF